MAPDIKNPRILQKLIHAVENNPACVEGLLQGFPMHLLQEVSPRDEEVISLIGDVLMRFNEHLSVFDDVKRVAAIFKFYISNITAQTHVQSCNVQLFHKLLLEFFAMLKSASTNVHFSFNDASIVLLADCMRYSGATRDIKAIAIDIFIYVVQNHILTECCGFETHAEVMWNEAKGDLSLKLAHVLIGNGKLSQSLPIMKEVYQYVQSTIGELHEATNLEAIQKILELLVVSFQNCEDKSILHELSVSLVKNNYPKSIQKVLEHEEIKKLVASIFMNELVVLFNGTPWDESTSLNDAIDQYLSSQINNFYGSDINFIVYYLDYYYNGHTDSEVKSKLKEQFANCAPTNPPVIKSLALLVATFFPTCTPLDLLQLQQQLLLALYERDEHYVTYHIDQLIWVLRFGSVYLKRKVLLLWFAKNPKTDEIVLAVRTTQQPDCLLDILYVNSNVKYQRYAYDLLQICKPCMPKIDNMLMNLLTRNNLTVDVIRIVLEKPLGVPDIDKERDLQVAQFLLNRLLGLCVIFELEEIDDCLREKIVVYLFTLCSVWQVKEDFNLAALIDAQFVRFLLRCFEHPDKHIVLVATKFLILILKAQQRCEIIAKEQIELSKYTLMGDDQIIYWSLVLYKFLIFGNHNRPIIVMNPPYLDIYQQLLDVLPGKHGNLVVELLIGLMKQFDICATSISNIFAIRIYVQNYKVDDAFNRFVISWCKRIVDFPFVNVPWKSINKHVENLRHFKLEADANRLKEVVRAVRESLSSD